MKNIEDKIYEIIEKMYENDDLSDKNIALKVEESLEKGNIEIFYSETDQGYSFETKYNLKEEQLEFLIDEKIQEVYKLPINEMIEIADMDKEEFHQEFSSLSLDLEILEIKKEVEIEDPWAKKIENLKSKENSLENEI